MVYRNYYSGTRFNKTELEKYKSYSYAQLEKLQKDIPFKLNSLSAEIEKLEVQIEKITQKESKILDEIEDDINKQIGKKPSGSFSKSTELIFLIISFCISTFLLNKYVFIGEIWISVILSFWLGMGIVMVPLYGVAESLLNLDLKGQERRYNKNLKAIENKVNEKIYNRYKTSEKSLNKNKATLENKVSKIRKRKLIYYGLRDNIFSLKSRAKRREEKAKIFAFNNKAREGARVVKEYLLKAVKDKKNWKCPYCNIKKDVFKSEGDHIHPVSKGGLSTTQNMTLICKPCNKNKKTSTLRSFSKKFQLDYERICRRLELDGKDV